MRKTNRRKKLVIQDLDKLLIKLNRRVEQLLERIYHVKKLKESIENQKPVNGEQIVSDTQTSVNVSQVAEQIVMEQTNGL